MKNTSAVSAKNKINFFRQIIWSCESKKGIYIVRWFLLRTRWCGVYLHHFHSSDEERALHDHPWSFVTVLLSHGYFEHTQEGDQQKRTWYPRFSVLRRHATHRHRVEIVQPCWSLVFRGPIVRPWGFWTKQGWMHWRDYGKQYCD